MVNWLQQFLSSRDTVLTAKTKTLLIDPPETRNGQQSLGFQRYTYQGRQLIGHYGGDRGFRSFLLLDVEAGIGLVVFGNGDFNEEFREEVLFRILDRVAAGRGQ